MIAQGREVYENALKDPQSLAEDISEDEAGDIELEDILSVSYDAYKNEKPEKMIFMTKLKYQSIPK